jgi:hypothetical protein
MGAGTVLRVRRAYPLVLASVLLAGCGASSGGQSLTREQYAGHADAICSKFKQKTDAIGQPSTLAELARVTGKVIPVFEQARGELRKLEPPAAEQATANAWLKEFDVLLKDLKTIRAVATRGDASSMQAVAKTALRDNEHANELGTQLGMRVCSKD